MSSYDEAELAILWDTISTDYLDLLKEMCTNSYNAGYKACEEDTC